MMPRAKKPISIVLCGMSGVGKTMVTHRLANILCAQGYRATALHFDILRKKFAPYGTDPFSADLTIKEVIYTRVAEFIQREMYTGETLVLDVGGSYERFRKNLKKAVPELKIIHLHCPLLVAFWRETKRSCRLTPHGRGRFLYLRAIATKYNPFIKEKFPQPGVTYPFEYPACADVHINTFLTTPQRIAQEIVNLLRL